MSTQDDGDSITREPLRGGENINATAIKGRDYSSIIDQKAIKRKKFIKWGIIISLILIAVILAIVLPITLSKNSGGGDNPGPGPDPPTPPPPIIPEHYNPYKVNPSDVASGSSAFSALMKAPSKYDPHLHSLALDRVNPVLKDGEKKLGINTRDIPEGPNNLFSSNVRMNVDMIKWRLAHLTLTDDDKTRYSIPEQAVKKPVADDTMRLDMLGFHYSSDPFFISFNDTRNKSNWFLSTFNQSLVFMDKFIQMDFLLPSQRLYGLGERVHDFQLDEGTWTMWAIGLDSPYDDGTGRKGVYGVHPFVLVQTAHKNDYIGIFFRNSNAQSPVIKYNADGTSILSYITIGGQLEIYFFIHGTAKDIIAQYHQFFGKPNLPPFWSLGWQQASWKYTNRQMVENVIDQYSQNQMPLETVYLDIPYMKNYADFTVDDTAFPKLYELADRLHNASQRLVLIVDAAISAEDASENNTYFTMGQKDSIFIKSSMYKSDKYNNTLIAKVWPEVAVFVDWWNPKCMNMWATGLKDLYNQVQYDGLWIDMNEPTTFNHGELDHSKVKSATKETPRFLQSTEYDYNWYYQFKQDESSTFKLPFIPRYDPTTNGTDPYKSNYDYMTLSLNATVDGLNGAYQYDVHSLYGHMMANKTHLFMTSNLGPRPDDRPFILTRSSFASTGRYASHWLGDNWRDWNYMRYSIAGIMNMNMFGIPQAGADVCGFFGEKKDDEMCARWIQLATFYPLARNHQNLTWKGNDSEFSEPYTLSGKYKDWARQSMRERFRYMRQLYTCLYEVSQNGGTCFDPLFYHFAEDDNVYGNYSTAFIYANAIKVSPVLQALEENQTSFKSYFPKGQWVSLNNFASIINSTGDWYDLPIDQPVAQSHLKPGSLIAYQNLITAKGQQVMTTSDLLQQPISILINRDESGFAQGSLLLDEGISISELKNNEFEYYTVIHQAKSIQLQLSAGLRGKQDNLVEQVVILNAKDMRIPAFACYMDMNKKFNTMTTKYDDVTNALYLTPKSATKFSQILNVYYGNQGDLNLCDTSSFQYRVPNGQPGPNLTLNYTEFDLEHVAGILPDLHVTLRVLSNYIVNVKWSWKLDQDGNLPQGKRKPAEVPNDIIDTQDKPLANLQLNQFVSWQANPFQLNFKYRSQVAPSNVLTIHGMLYDSYLNWIDVTVNTLNDADFSGVFGLGERASNNFFLQDGIYGMWARDQPTPDEMGTLPGANMYGTHPYFMYKHKKQAWVGVLYKLAHAQDWWVKNDINGGMVNLTTIATGGVVDIYVIQGQTPDAVVQNYFSLIGNPVLIPQWALGWHQSRWGYTSVDQLQNVLDGYENKNIPLDTIWSDIDYLNQYRDFEYDKSNDTFAGLPQFVDYLHNNKSMRYVPILDAGLAYRPGEYPAFDDGMAKGLFTKINNETTFIGQVWPNDAVYPDFFHPDTPAWWKSNLESLYNQIKFDGLWEDMNEASNFCNGVCYQDQKVQNPMKQNLQYIPTGRDLETKSMPLDVTHYNGYLELDAHNYFGTQEVKLTHEWFKDMGMRTFIIERSSFAGSGKFASRWLGDNFSQEKYMGYSVTGIMLMNIFGIPFSGADICGFIDDTNAKLCTKWHLVGAFYPFSRNHNNWGQIPQEPYVDMFNENYEMGMKYMDLMRNSILLKYSLVRYYYTYMFLISTQGIGTFYKPLFFEFPDDINAYQEINKNVMLGPALKLSINPESLEDNSTIYYFPQGVWCDIIKLDKCMNSTGQEKPMTNKLYDFGLHIRQGYIVPFQDMSLMEDVKTTKALQNKTIDLHILGESSQPGNSQWRAQGLYVNDDGVSTNLTGNFNSYSIVAKSSNGIQINFFTTVKATAWKDTMETGCYAVNRNDYVQNIYIYNANAYGNGKDYAATGVMIGGTDPVDLGTAKYNAETDRVELSLAGAICMSKLQSITLQ